ncbi:MAG: MFS transporter [Planctomycetes bacterium]|nr:MFS transporter [Planctomycetota bacterium]MCB9884908.1 MFS transporter [Planctomycetota bacterium]
MNVIRLYRDAFSGLPARTWLLAIAGFLNRAGSMVVPFLGLYLKDRFGYTPTEAGAVVGLYGAGAFLGSWLGGWLADRLGPVRVQVVTLGAASVWMLLMSTITQPLALAAAVFVLGVVNDAFRPGAVTAAAISAEPHLRRKALSLNRLAVNAGWAFGPTIGGYLVTVDFSLMFVADGLTCGLAAIWLGTRLGGWNPAPPPHQDTGFLPLRPFKDRYFLGLMGANLIVLVAFMQYFTTGSRVLEDAGYSKSEVGWFLAINPIVITLFEMPLVHALMKKRALPLIALGSLVVGVGYLCMLLPLGWGALALAMLVVAVGELLQMPLLGSHLNDHAPAHLRGAYNGAYGMTFCLALILAPPLGGWTYDTFGSSALWWSCGAVGALASLWFWTLRRREATAATA